MGTMIVSILVMVISCGITLYMMYTVYSLHRDAKKADEKRNNLLTEVPNCEWQQINKVTWKLYSKEKDCWIATVTKTDEDLVYMTYRSDYPGGFSHSKDLVMAKMDCKHYVQRKSSDTDSEWIEDDDE